jgi:cytochrome c oxidase subunit 2
MRPGRYALAIGALLAAAGCQDDQSVLSPRSVEADRLAILSWVLFIGGGLIFIAVMALALLAVLARGGRIRALLARERAIVWGGIVFPSVTLAALLAAGLVVTRAGAGMNYGADQVRIKVVGELWWWRVIYTAPDGRQFEAANEVRVPVGRPVAIELSSGNVIHSFWVPNLAGKLDMIPGRTNVLRLTTSSPGVSRGQCAEYCGGAHALMAFHVVALPAGDFDRWLRSAGGPVPEPDLPLLVRGRDLFLSHGCGACHTIRGTPALGRIGPDLTGVGGRASLAAGILPNTIDAFSSWITSGQQIKPGNKMPDFAVFSTSDLLALSSYLESLK